MEIFRDYLKPSVNQIRHSIRGIDDSYNNSWDILAELIQNSVDAIRQKPDVDGKIIITIDCINKKIAISDNGIGISPRELPELLKPFSTNKTGISNMIGEKGVGLKYVIFQSNQFTIKSGNQNGTSTGRITNAKNWKNDDDENLLPLEYEIIDEELLGTEIELREIENEVLFNLNLKQIVHALRTHTAIGNTFSIWHPDINIDVTLNYTDINGTDSTENIPFTYKLITESIPTNSKIDLDNFVSWTQDQDRTDEEKMQKLRDKVIFRKGNFMHQNCRELKYFAVFVPKRKIWNDISINSELCTEENIEDESWLSEYFFTKFDKGIYLSTKGMPTGITIDHPTTGWAGYWSNFFILFDDSFLKFDIGRKAIHGRQASIHKEYSKRIFNEFLQYVTKYVSGDVAIEPTEWDKDEIFDDIESIINLNIEWLKFQKVPSSQEATVAAIFFECIGNGRINGLIPLISGYRSKYDLYAKWGRKKVIIEFKSKLSNVCRDFEDARKMFDEINCIVCWEITDDDYQKLSHMQINVEKIDKSVFASSASRRFPHSTHIMNLSGFSNPVYIIDLKEFIRKQNEINT